MLKAEAKTLAFRPSLEALTSLDADHTYLNCIKKIHMATLQQLTLIILKIWKLLISSQKH